MTKKEMEIWMRVVGEKIREKYGDEELKKKSAKELVELAIKELKGE